MLETIKPKTRTRFNIGERVLDMQDHRKCVVVEIKQSYLEGVKANYVLRVEGTGPDDKTRTVPEVGLIPLRYNI